MELNNFIYNLFVFALVYRFSAMTSSPTSPSSHSSIPGRLTLEEFREEVNNFVLKSDLLHDGWFKAQTNSSPESIHLVKKIVKSLPINTEPPKEAARLLPVPPSDVSFDEEEELRQDEEEDDSSVIKPTPYVPFHTMITLEYHIVYSTSYQVPVLYFNAYKPNGRLLTLEELWTSIPRQYAGVDKWSFLSQQEHPLLGRPFFQLHPCHTETFMSKLGKCLDKRYYIIRWISAVGPAVHLDISLGFASA